MLHRLPTELALHILAYVPLKSLADSAAVSTEWSQLVSVNELQIYRNAAILHGFVSPKATVDADIATRAGGWKELCKRILQYERSWRGHAPVTSKELSAGGKSVHRIKVDEDRRIVITTIQRGGLYVTDLDTNAVLWSLPRGYIAEFAHCEYERGFLVFTRPDSCYEVWCTADQTDVQPSEAFPPNDFQAQIADVAAATHATTPAKGRFKPHALLQCPEETRALRLSYPTFFVAGTNSAFLWDIVSGALVQTLTGLQRQPGTLGSVRYVEVTPDYAITCGSESFRMFSREDSSVVFMLQQDDFPTSKRRVLPAENTSHQLAPMKIGPVVKTSGLEELMAAHVTASGDLVLLTCGASLIIYRNIKGIISGDVQRDASVLQLDFTSKHMYSTQSATYLAVDRNRIALSTYEGIFILSVSEEVHPITGIEPTDIASSITVAHLTQFKNKQWLRFVSCLQLTPRGAYFNWKPSGKLPAAHVRSGHQVDNPLGMSVQIEGVGEFGIGPGLVQAVQEHVADIDMDLDGEDDLVEPEDIELPPLEGLGDVDEEPLLNGQGERDEDMPAPPGGGSSAVEVNGDANGAHRDDEDVDVLFDTAEEAQELDAGPSTSTAAAPPASTAKLSTSATSPHSPSATTSPPPSTSSTAATNGTAVLAALVASQSATVEEVDDDDDSDIRSSPAAGATTTAEGETPSSPSMPALMEMSDSDDSDSEFGSVDSGPPPPDVGDDDDDIVNVNDESDSDTDEDDVLFDPLWPAVQNFQLNNDQIQILLNEFLFPMTLSTVHCVLFDQGPLP